MTTNKPKSQTDRHFIALDKETMDDFRAIVERDGTKHRSQVQLWIKRDKKEHPEFWTEHLREKQQQADGK